MSLKAAVHGRPGALRSADMHDTSRALLQAASGSHSESGLPQKHGQRQSEERAGWSRPGCTYGRSPVAAGPHVAATGIILHGRHLHGVSCCSSWSHGAQVPWACAPLARIEDLSGATGGPSARAWGLQGRHGARPPLAAALEHWPSQQYGLGGWSGACQCLPHSLNVAHAAL